MRPIVSVSVRSAALSVALACATVACGSSGDSDSPADSATASTASVGGEPEVAPEDEVAPDEAPAGDTATTTAATSAGDDGSGEVILTLSDARSWVFTSTMCTFDPEATGPAAAVINIGGVNDDGLGIDVIEAWPLDGSTETGTSFIATFVDENDELFIFVDGSAAMAGDAVEVTANYYNDVMYEDGDTPDGSAVIRCIP